MFLPLDPHNGIPLGVQIALAIRRLLATRQLRPGDQLPSARELAAELRVNFHTVRKAFQDLEATGLLETRRGLGTFVAASEPAVADELRGLIQRHVQSLLDELAGSPIEPDQLRELWLEEWDRITNAKRAPKQTP